MSGRFDVTFWGVRGSIACPGPETARYGGNTSCLEVRCGARRLVFDAGTGLRYLGETFPPEADLDLFLTHTHYDHVIGLPFFKPLFSPQTTARLWAGHCPPPRTIRSVLEEMMTPPLFPVPLDIFACELSFNDFTPGDVLRPGEGIEILTTALNHPNGAVGYRVNYDGKAIAYVTDTEHRAGTRDPDIVDLIRGADVFIYDATYTDEEYAQFTGWGHSTWQEGARLAEAAEVGTYVIFHHDPAHDDDFMDDVAAQAAAMRPGSVVAREGLVISP